MTSTYARKSGTATRPIRARRVHFEYPAGTKRQYYVRDDLVMSHIVSVLSAMFPEGEQFFIRSVREFSDQITDPVLRQQVKGFIGQEVTHGREHQHLNERLAEMGYPTARIDRHVRQLLLGVEKLLGKKVSLATTAALEHYTATLAETLLTSPRAQRLLGESETRQMLLWHALEESEHKAVAFDVYRNIGGSEPMRIVVMDIASAIFWTEVIMQSLRSLAGDRSAYNLPRLARSVADLRKLPFLGPTPRKRMLSYHRVGFHPDEWDASALIDRWSAELFGAANGAGDSA